MIIDHIELKIDYVVVFWSIQHKFDTAFNQPPVTQ